MIPYHIPIHWTYIQCISLTWWSLCNHMTQHIYSQLMMITMQSHDTTNVVVNDKINIWLIPNKNLFCTYLLCLLGESSFLISVSIIADVFCTPKLFGSYTRFFFFILFLRTEPKTFFFFTAPFIFCWYDSDFGITNE